MDGWLQRPEITILCLIQNCTERGSNARYRHSCYHIQNHWTYRKFISFSRIEINNIQFIEMNNITWCSYSYKQLQFIKKKNKVKTAIDITVTFYFLNTPNKLSARNKLNFFSLFLTLTTKPSNNNFTEQYCLHSNIVRCEI